MLNIHVHMRYKYTHRLRLRKSTSKWSGWIIRKYRNSFYYGWSWMKRQHTTISYSFIRTGRVRKQRVWKKKRKKKGKETFYYIYLPSVYANIRKLQSYIHNDGTIRFEGEISLRRVLWDVAKYSQPLRSSTPRENRGREFKFTILASRVEFKNISSCSWYVQDWRTEWKTLP